MSDTNSDNFQIILLAERIREIAGRSAPADASAEAWLTPREAAAWLPMRDGTTREQRSKRFEYLRTNSLNLRTRMVGNRFEVNMQDWRKIIRIEQRLRRAEDEANGF